MADQKRITKSVETLFRVAALQPIEETIAALERRREHLALARVERARAAELAARAEAMARAEEAFAREQAAAEAKRAEAAAAAALAAKSTDSATVAIATPPR